MSTPSSCKIGDLLLDSGITLTNVEIGYTTFGTLNPDRSNVVVVFHALTGSTNAAEWWGSIIGDGKSINPAHEYVICINSIGSCYGSTGPERIDPNTGEKYARRFPKLTTRDIARSQLRALRDLGIDHARLGIGGSMGAMILLELAVLDPSFFDAVVVIACGASHTAWRIGFSSVIRKTIESVADSFAGSEEGYIAGMKLARQLGMLSYRCNEEFESRFARYSHEGKFEVEHYLEHQGDKIAARFSPYSYLRLTEAMETYDVSAELALLHCPALFVGIDSDILYPESEIRALARSVPFGAYATLHAGFGHDSFLVSSVDLAAVIGPFIAQHSTRPITEEVCQ